MIIDSVGMKKIESSSSFSSQQLMEQVGKQLAEEIMHAYTTDTKVLILVGKGNNGGDGYVVAKYLKGYDFDILQCDGKPSSKECKKASSFIDKKHIHSMNLKYIDKADLIIDAVYGFSYHDELNKELRKLFRQINESNKTVWSIDINSGAESDSGHYDIDTIHSDITWAIDCYKPFHLGVKEHQLFKEVRLINLHLDHSVVKSKYHEMNEEIFFNHFPKKPVNAYKGSYGKTLLAGGGYGTAGALSLNIIGAKTVGAPYINVALPDEIYNIVATQHITPVYHPFGHETWEKTIEPLIKEAKAIAFGSGAMRLSRKNEVMDKILQESTSPVVLDAEALRLLDHNTWVLRFTKCPVILTPHLGEFATISGKTIEVIKDRPLDYVKEFAQKHKVYVVLKGANTIVASPCGDTYINQTGNQALAQAGSGDLLTGILAGLLTLTTDIFTAICMSVWLHGYLSDYGLKDYSIQSFPIEKYPELMNEVFKRHGF